MKVAVVSDVHLNLRKNIDFESGRFHALISSLAQSDANLIVFNGDLFDKARPSLEEIANVNKAISALEKNSKEVIILAGNHEAVSKDKSTYDFLGIKNVKKFAKLELEGVSVLLCDWFNLFRLQEESADVLISHFRGDVPPFIEEEVVTTDFKDNFDLGILGDIHFRHTLHGNMFYTSSPYSIHFSKTQAEYGYIMLNIIDGSPMLEFINLELPSKIKHVQTAEEFDISSFTKTDLHLVEVHGTVEELQKIEGSSNVIVRKFIALEETKEQDSPVAKVDFIDDLSNRVSNNLSLSKAEVKEVLDTLYKEA